MTAERIKKLKLFMNLQNISKSNLKGLLQSEKSQKADNSMSQPSKSFKNGNSSFQAENNYDRTLQIRKSFLDLQFLQKELF